MHVRAYHNDGLTYLVDSESRKGNHMVNLAAHGGNAECSCEHFRIRLFAEFKANGSIPSNETRCKHILACREYLADEVISKLSRQTAFPTPRRQTCKEIEAEGIA